MTENEDKRLNNNFKIITFFKFSYSWKYVINISINFKKLLEALLLEYIDFIQYEIYFGK